MGVRVATAARLRENGAMAKRVWMAAVLTTGIIFGLSACGSDDNEPSSDPPTTTKESAASETPTTQAATEPPEVFEALACDSVAAPEADVFTCRRAKSIARFWVDADPNEVVPKVMRSGRYNPNGDVFYSTEEGVLYLPGGEFFEAQLVLAEPNDAYGAEVIDTDTLG